MFCDISMKSITDFFSSVDWGTLFSSSLKAFWSVVPDIIQILILYLVIYSILKAARGSRFGQVLLGAGVLVAALAFFTLIFQFDVLQKILWGMLIYLAVSSVVIFQPEIRRFLETLGTLLLDDRPLSRSYSNEVITPEALADSILLLAERRIGALFAFERGISLRGYEMTGVVLDASISTGLLVSIFTPPLPLHDGGAIIRSGRLAAAHCLFPVSNNTIGKLGLSSSGMRHRAAVGITEETDAFVIVVSEERGQVSIAYNGQLKRYPDLSPQTRNNLILRIRKVMPNQQTRIETVLAWLNKRGGLAARFVNWFQHPTLPTAESPTSPSEESDK